MHGNVPLARRNLLADPRRLLTSAIGVGLAIMLILLLDGLWAGIQGGVVATRTTSAQTSTWRSPAPTTSTAPVAESRSAPSTPSAPILRSSGRRGANVLRDHRSARPQGRDTRRRIDPRRPRRTLAAASGRAPTANNEIVVGKVLAQRHNLNVGQTIDVAGHQLTIVGTGADTFMASFVFMTHAATDELLGAPNTTSFVLVGTMTRLRSGAGSKPAGWPSLIATNSRRTTSNSWRARTACR